MSDSPESLTRMRRKAGSVTDGEPGEPPDDHVLARLGGELGAQGLDRLALVLVGVDVLLVEQDDLREPLAHPPLGDPRAHVLRLVGGLLLEDPPLARAVLLGHLVLGHVQRGRRGNVQGDVPGERDEVGGAGHEVGLAVDLDQHADLRVGVDVALDRPLGGHPLAALGGLRLALDPQDLDGLVDVAAGLGQRLLAVHHPRARAVAQGLDVAGGDGGHRAGSSWSALCSLVCGVGWGLAPSSVVCAWSSSAGGTVGVPSSGPARLSTCCSASATWRSASWRSGVSVWTSASSAGMACGWACCSARASAWRRTASSSASRRACSSASRRSWASRSSRARSSSARKTARPSATTSPTARVTSAHERIASSLPGTTNWIPSGSQLVSTTPMIGMRRRWASRTAITSVLRSTTKIASGTRCMFLTPPRLARSLFRSASADMRSRVGSRLSWPSVS